jgi:ADP-heptose:LPS heptosyltransferase
VTFRTKRWVDYWLGGFLLAILFVPVRLLGLVLRRDHGAGARRGCVVIKLAGAGSLFMAMPAMQEIRGQFPVGKFYLVGMKPVTGFAGDFAWFDECWTIDDSSLLRMVSSTLRVLCKMALHADHLIDLEIHSRLTTVLGILSTVRNRIGFVDEIVFWRRGFYTHMTFFNMHGPVYVFYDMLAQWFGIDTVPVTDFNARFRRRVLTENLPPGSIPAVPFIAIGHACSDLGRERQLRPDEWKRLLMPLILSGHEFLLLGGSSDAPLADAIIAELGRGHNLCGRLSIAQSAKMIAVARDYYGIDSLLLHLARALGTSTVSVFGPTSPDILLRPMGTRERVAFARLPCAPCIHVNETPPCQGRRTCMAQALEDLVADGVPATSHRTRASVGWEVEPGVSRVKEVSVDYA